MYFMMVWVSLVLVPTRFAYDIWFDQHLSYYLVAHPRIKFKTSCNIVKGQNVEKKKIHC